MALFGSKRDARFVKGINHELVRDIVSQQCGYYKPKLDEININVYGEGAVKTYIGPVLLKCLIQRDNYNWKVTDQGLPDVSRTFEFRFIKDDLINAEILTDQGDIIVWEDSYFEVEATNENRLFFGKNDEYPYSEFVDDFGSSLHVICTAHYARPEIAEIIKNRL